MKTVYLKDAPDGEYVSVLEHERIIKIAMGMQAKACADALCNAEPFSECAGDCPYHGGCGVYKYILNATPEEK